MNKIKLIITTITLLLIDITIKLIVKSNLALHESIKVINNFFYITYVNNKGVAWSILSGKVNLIIIITSIIILLLTIYILKKDNYTKLDIITYSLILSGSLGNLLDRIIYGYVIDYLDFYIFNYNYPIFNFADICIVLGIILLFLGGKNGNNIRNI